MLTDFRIDFGQDGLQDWISVELVFSGCRKALSGNPCKGCHNPALWTFENSGPFENPMQALEKQLLTWKEKDVEFEGIVLLGGEPVDQDPDEVIEAVGLVHQHYPDLPVMIYIGYDTLDELPQTSGKIVALCDFVKIGGYKEEIPPREGSRLASGNQRVYRCAEGVLGEEIFF